MIFLLRQNNYYFAPQQISFCKSDQKDYPLHNETIVALIDMMERKIFDLK